MKDSFTLKNSTISQIRIVVKTVLWLVSNGQLVAEIGPLFSSGGGWPMQCAQYYHTMIQCAQKCPKVHKRLQRCTLWRLRVSGMVRRPYHGPRVDVEELASTARPVAVIANSPGIVRRLQLVPVIRDRPVRAVGDQGQSAQDVMDRDNVDDRFRLRLIEELGSSVGNLPPPVRQPPAGCAQKCT